MKSITMRFPSINYYLAALCLVSTFLGGRAASITPPTSTSSPSYTVNNGGFLQPLEYRRRKKRRNASSILRSTKEELLSSSSLSSTNNEEENNTERSVPDNEPNNDDVLASPSSANSAGDTVVFSVVESEISSENVAVGEPTSTSASRWKRRKQIALGLVSSIVATVGVAKVGLLGGSYTNSMIARDAFMTGLTSVLAVVMNRSITWGYESGKYDSKTGRKITHILSAPLFIITWPFFSDAGGARVFAGLVTLTNMYRLYLAGTGDAAESSLANTISRSGDKSEVLGGPFIYVCLFQCFILAFWRDTFPGVVAMTTMAAGDGMADIIGRRYGKNGYKWPFGDRQKSLAGTAAFGVFAFGLTLAICSWLIATGVLPSSLAFSELATRIFAISCICALVEVLPVGDDNYTVPGSAALLSWLWLR